MGKPRAVGERARSYDEPRHPRLHGVPRQTEAIRQCHHGRARVRRERSQELKVDMVKSGHIAEG